VIAYTDGVIEATNPLGVEWGVDGIKKAAVENKARRAEEVVNAIFESLDEYSQGQLSDDATVAVMHIL
jgi:serine phosphatase RsbU (regulator of sigma subunit)